MPNVWREYALEALCAGRGGELLDALCTGREEADGFPPPTARLCDLVNDLGLDEKLSETESATWKAHRDRVGRLDAIRNLLDLLEGFGARIGSLLSLEDRILLASTGLNVRWRHDDPQGLFPDAERLARELPPDEFQKPFAFYRAGEIAWQFDWHRATSLFRQALLHGAIDQHPAVVLGVALRALELSGSAREFLVRDAERTLARAHALRPSVVYKSRGKSRTTGKAEMVLAGSPLERIAAAALLTMSPNLSAPQKAHLKAEAEESIALIREVAARPLKHLPPLAFYFSNLPVTEVPPPTLNPNEDAFTEAELRATVRAAVGAEPLAQAYADLVHYLNRHHGSSEALKTLNEGIERLPQGLDADAAAARARLGMAESILQNDAGYPGRALVAAETALTWTAFAAQPLLTCALVGQHDHLRNFFDNQNLKGHLRATVPKRTPKTEKAETTVDDVRKAITDARWGDGLYDLAKVLENGAGTEALAAPTLEAVVDHAATVEALVRSPLGLRKKMNTVGRYLIREGLDRRPVADLWRAAVLPHVQELEIGAERDPDRFQGELEQVASQGVVALRQVDPKTVFYALRMARSLPVAPGNLREPPPDYEKTRAHLAHRGAVLLDWVFGERESILIAWTGEGPEGYRLPALSGVMSDELMIERSKREPNIGGLVELMRERSSDLLPSAEEIRELLARHRQVYFGWPYGRGFQPLHLLLVDGIPLCVQKPCAHWSVFAGQERRVEKRRELWLCANEEESHWDWNPLYASLGASKTANRWHRPKRPESLLGDMASSRTVGVFVHGAWTARNSTNIGSKSDRTDETRLCLKEGARLTVRDVLNGEAMFSGTQLMLMACGASRRGQGGVVSGSGLASAFVARGAQSALGAVAEIEASVAMDMGRLYLPAIHRGASPGAAFCLAAVDLWERTQGNLPGFIRDLAPMILIERAIA